MYPAVAKGVPFMKQLLPRDEDLSFELESELGIARIAGVSDFNVFRQGMTEMPGFILHQGGARYTWDGQITFGQVERSNYADTLAD